MPSVDGADRLWRAKRLGAASAIGNLDLTRALLESRIDDSVTTGDGWTPIYIAAHKGHLEVLELLAKAGGDINISDNGGRTPLYVAVFRGHFQVAKLLVDCGADVSLPNKHGETPLMLAADYGYLELARLFLDKGARIDDSDEEGWTALHAAATTGSADMVKLLLDRGANIEACNDGGRTPLFSAVSRRHIDVVKLLLDRNANIEALNNEGRTPLCLACIKGNADIVKLLIDRGASITVTEFKGKTPLFLASQNGRAEVVRELIAHGGDSSIPCDEEITPLMAASYHGHIHVVKLLVEKNTSNNLEAVDSLGQTALGTASRNGRTEVVEFLINQGCNISATDHKGWSLINLATERGHIEVVETLLEYGADPTIPNDERETPLNTALQNGHTEIARLLIDHDAGIHATDEIGNTPLSIASAKGYTNMVALLLSNGANPSAANKFGWTPLMEAAYSGFLEVVRLLLANGASIEAANAKGETTLKLASSSGHLEVVRFLLQHGADATTADTAGQMAIGAASFRGYYPVVKLLLGSRADCSTQNAFGLSPLHHAAAEGHDQIVRLLLGTGTAPIDAKTHRELWTPLNIASSRGYCKVVRLLLHHQANTEIVNRAQRGPLVSAIINGHVEVVRALLRHGADISVKNEAGATPVHYAARFGQLEILKQLIREGADIMALSKDNMTSLHQASLSGHVELVKFILDKGANILSPDVKGNLPIHAATRAGNVEVVKLLLERGSPLIVANKTGMTPLSLADDRGHFEILQLLIDKCADESIARIDGRQPILNEPYLTRYMYPADMNSPQNRPPAGSGAQIQTIPTLENATDYTWEFIQTLEHEVRSIVDPEGPAPFHTSAPVQPSEKADITITHVKEHEVLAATDPKIDGPVSGTLCNTCNRMFRNQAGEIHPDMGPSFGNLGRSVASDAAEGTPVQSRFFRHHLSANNLHEAYLEGCYICKRVWGRIDPAMRRVLLDFESTMLSPWGRTTPITCCLSLDSIPPPSLSKNSDAKDPAKLIWAVVFHEDAIEMANLSPDVEMQVFALTPSEDTKHYEYSSILSSAANSEESLAFATSQFRNCVQNHKACSGQFRKTSWLPSRLICVDDPEDNHTVRLVLSQDVTPDNYCTLSHCWGSAPFLKLTKDNIGDLLRGIQILDLPRTFRDTILVSQKLGVRYIWIDALCIIQDDPDDWLKEASQMDMVYANSVCNICATGSQDPTGGLFTVRDPKISQPCHVEVPWFEGSGSFRIWDLQLWKHQVVDAPLNNRAWVVQERHLSERKLHFTSSQVIWECLERTAAEEFPNGLPDKVKLRHQNTRCLFREPRHSTETEDTSRILLYEWPEIVGTYMRCKLSRSADRIIAFEGIKRRFESILDDKCVAGLWEKNLENGLLWFVKDCIQGDGTPSTRPDIYRAPSFSWMSVEGIVGLDMEKKSSTLLTKVLSFSAEESRGIIANARIRLKCVLRPVQILRFHLPKEEKWYAKFRLSNPELGSILARSSAVFMDVDRDYNGTYYAMLVRTKDTGPELLGLILEESGGAVGEFKRVGLFQACGEESALLRGHYGDESTYPCESYDEVERKHIVSII